MKDIFNRRQRFSLRKYSVGVCSVLLGTALFVAGAPSASAEEVTATPESSTETAATETASSTEVAAETTTTESSSYEAPAALVATSEPVTTASSEKAEATTETSKASEEDKKTEEASKEDKKSEDKKSEDKKSEDKKSSTEAKAEKATTSATSEATTEATSSSEPETTSLAANPAVQPLNASANKPVADSTATTSATTLSAASTETATAGALETSRSRRRGRRAATDHNTEPVSTTSTLAPDTEATPTMDDPNGATVSSQDVPDPTFKKKDGDVYTYHILNLTKFNERYNVNYYTRTYKNFDSSTNSVVELVDKNTGNVIEIVNVSPNSGIKQFTKTTLASNGELTLQVDYQPGIGAGANKKDQPFLQFGYDVSPAIKALSVNPPSQADADKYLAVMSARTSNDIMNVVEPTYNGRDITDTNVIIPSFLDKTTYYKVVDKSSASYNKNKSNPNIIDYKPTGNEVDLATYTISAVEGQKFNASGVREFTAKDVTVNGEKKESKYKLYQTADPDTMRGYVSRPYVVGTKFMDADRYGIKRIKEVVKEDGTVVVRVYLLDPRQQSKRSDGTLSTDGYMLLAETEPIPPGEQNTKPLTSNGLKTVRTIPFNGYPDGEELEVKLQSAAGYTPFKTLFVPFLGDGIGNGTDNGKLSSGSKAGTNVDLMNSLTPYKQPIYYYVQEPLEVTPEFTKVLEDLNAENKRTLQDGDFSFTIEGTSTNTNGYKETVENKAGKVTFKKLKFDTEGTYTYKISEVKPASTDANANVDYDAMEVVMTVKVEQKSAAGDLKATVTYSSSKGETSSTNDTEFNNFVVAPVTAQFDFSKVLAGRQLNAGEFSFELVDPSDTSTDPNGKVLQTKTNDANGLVKFDALTFKNGQEGTHKYIVREVQGSLTGVTYDTMKAEVTVTVTKSGHALAAVTTLPTDTVFNNTYTPSPASAQFRFTKKLEGKTLQGDDFEFELLENGNVIQTKKNVADGSITFDAIPYATEGVHTYTVREKAGNDTNIDYDAMNATVTVTVTKDATTGLLNAAVTLPTDTEFNNYVVPPVPVNVNFTKALAGRALVAGEFTFEMKDENGVVVATGTNDEHGVVTFNQLPEVTNAQVGKVIKYTVSEKVPANKEFGVTYDNMVAEVSVSVVKNATTHALQAVVTYPGGDTEFNNTVTPPTTPDFQPEKFIVNKEKYDITGTKLMDDDDELADEYTDTNANPYADGTANNEPENLNTKTVKKGDKIVYQVWLDTTNLKASDNIQAVGISDKYEADKLEINVADIKAYDSVTGVDVTDKFDITVNNGVITATSKASFIKDINNDPVIDTTLFEFGRYYKFDIPATVKTTTPNGVDIENTANQIVHQYDPTNRNITKPEKPTQKRVVNLPVPLEFDFTKKLDGRNLVENEFTFVLKKDGVAIQTVKNSAPDATTGIAKIAFKPLEFTKADAGNTFTYTVEEVAGTDATVSYDNMVATIKVEVKHDGTTKTTVVNKLQDAPDKEFNNTVKPPEEPKFNPEKYVVDKEKFDITGDKLVDDDSELADKYGDTNANPYADGTANNEPENLNTKTVKPGSKLVYQVWLDTTQFSATNTENIQTLSITDNYDEDKLDVDSIKVYDGVTGADVTSKFDIANTGGVITVTLKAGFTKSLGDANNTQIIDTTKFEFGRYYKVDIVTTVKTSVEPGKDIENTAGQIVHYYNPRTNKVEKPEKPTEKRVNSVPVPLELKFTKALDGRALQAGEFEFILEKDGVEVERVKNDAAGKINFKKLEFGNEDLGKTYNYTVREVAGTDATVTYDTMKANVTVTVSHDGTAKVLVATVGDIADKEFNNRVTPPEEPKFQPEKYVVSEEKFDITGDKLVDDDKELADKVADTNANPYADDASNNEAQNLNTKTVKRGDKLVYQVWLDTTKFDSNNKDNIQSVGISDDYDETKLDLDSTKIKAYDSVTGDDVTDKFDIAVNNGVITATLKAGFTKSLGDAENTQVIDTTKFAFGRYYKFDIPTTVKADVEAGVDIENTAAQVVNYYNPTTKKVEKPSKPTEKRVNSVPVEVSFNFTKKLEGRELKANEFSFVLKDSTGKVVETVKNDAAGNVKFSAIEFKKEQAGVHNYTVEEVAGTDATVTYDTMKANVTV
ncbi:FctA domain-containing protein, partial [Streptococcus parasanguinis]|uniref:Spy0128 family protein n=1 Tax=Streptococcus parasanguinis TaxID=1318 RepID=UPI0039C3A3EF